MSNPNQTASGPIAAGSWNRPHPYPTALELGESTALFSLSSDGGGGEGRGEESRFYWIYPLPNPPPVRSSQGEGERRSAFQCLIQWQRTPNPRRGCCARPMEATEVCRKEEGRMQNAGLVGGWKSGRGWPSQVAAATKTTEGNRINQDDPITSDQLRPNQTKSDQKKRSSPDQGTGRWIKTGADGPRFGSSALQARKC